MPKILIFTGSRTALIRYDMAGVPTLVRLYGAAKFEETLQAFSDSNDALLAVEHTLVTGFRVPSDTLIVFDESWKYAEDHPYTVQAKARRGVYINDNPVLVGTKRVNEDGKELAEIKARLADNKKLEDFVYHVFYANPIAFARKNLVIALQRYLLGQSLSTPEEQQRQLLDAMTEDERAQWWRAKNASVLND